MENDALQPKFCKACGANWREGVRTEGCANCFPPEEAPPPPIPAHRYPVWLMAFSAAVLLAAVYSLVLLPPFWSAARRMHAAESALARGDRKGAEKTLEKVLEDMPTSKSARIDMAVLLFGNQAEFDHQRALGYLLGMKLEKDDWRRVEAVLPEKYRDSFKKTDR